MRREQSAKRVHFSDFNGDKPLPPLPPHPFANNHTLHAVVAKFTKVSRALNPSKSLDHLDHEFMSASPYSDDSTNSRLRATGTPNSTSLTTQSPRTPPTISPPRKKLLHRRFLSSESVGSRRSPSTNHPSAFSFRGIGSPQSSRSSGMDFLCQGMSSAQTSSSLAAISHNALSHSIAPAEAQAILLKILCAMPTLRDLRNVAMINKGMYNTFKLNEAFLVKRVAHNESPSACELRTWLAMPSNRSRSRGRYMREWKRDLAVIDRIKFLISERCSQSIREESIQAFKDPLHSRSRPLTEAFWRTWTFCTIFGRSERSGDHIAQVDWFRGGSRANDFSCTANSDLYSSLKFDSILVNTPAHFGRGNGKSGLTHEEVADLLEIWTCLVSLLEGYYDRYEQAWKYGIYDRCPTLRGDISREKLFLREWTAYILTLGPPAVLALAEYATDPSEAGFKVAASFGWTKWAPTNNTSHATFLLTSVPT